MIKIPLRIVSEANASEHWTKKSKRHKLQKMLVRAYLQKERYGLPPYNITLTRHAPRLFDSDNLQGSFKYIRDALSEYLLDCSIAGRADSDARITWNYSQEKTKDKEYFITIRISS
jgi:hypothetical protein